MTGANSGLGFEAAKLLARLKCSTIVLACRSVEKGEVAKRSILETSSSSHPEILVRVIDLGSFSSVAKFADECKSLPRIDAAILNAGVHLSEFTLAEGYETTLTVNVISTFLLLTLLLPTLQQHAAKYHITPRIAVVGSYVHNMAKHKDLTDPRPGTIFKTLSDPNTNKMTDDRYNLSKLPVMLLVKYLAERATAATNTPSGPPLVVINNVAPGFCNTPLFRNHSTAARAAGLVGRTGEHGARTLVHGGVVAGKESHGQYLSECRVKKPSPFVNSKEGDATAQKIWDELKVIYEQVQPGCTAVF